MKGVPPLANRDSRVRGASGAITASPQDWIRSSRVGLVRGVGVEPERQRRLRLHGRRAMPDPRGQFSAPRNPVARSLVGRAMARRGESLGTVANPGPRASSCCSTHGGVLSAEESSREVLRGSSHGSTRGELGHSGESWTAGVELLLDPRGCSQRRGTQSRSLSWVETWLDAGRAWAQRRIPEHGRRAVPDPRGVLSAEESSREVFRGSSHGSTSQWHGHSDESANTGVGQCPTHGGCFRRRGIQSRSPSWDEQ
jgi:hypothetical protein